MDNINPISIGQNFKTGKWQAILWGRVEIPHRAASHPLAKHRETCYGEGVKGGRQMNKHPLHVIIFIIIGLLIATSFAYSASLLTDAELDSLGAGGEGYSEPTQSNPLQALSESDLEQVSGSAFPIFVWPFQALAKPVPSFRGILMHPGTDKDGTAIQLRGVPLRKGGLFLLSPLKLR